MEERKKLYEAIGYSENAKLATYSAEVCIHVDLQYYYTCRVHGIVLMELCVLVCGSLFEL